MIRTAEFSECRKYRYVLTRIWEPDSPLPLLGLIGKNPSVANSEKDDPTIGKEIALGKRLKCRGLLKVNMFDYIATDASELLNLTCSLWPSGDNLVRHIVERLKDAGCYPIVCCWGTHTNKYLREQIHNRGYQIRTALIEAGMQPMCLKMNADRTPAHPLYLPANLELRPY